MNFSHSTNVLFNDPNDDDYFTSYTNVNNIHTNMSPASVEPPPSAFDLSIYKMHSARMVVMEMGIAFFGIVFNLIVLISIREKESLLNSTINVVLANLCFANLVSAVFVKSIAVIYNGYAVAAALWEVNLAFCTIHTITFRATWAVFPYSIVVLCWHGLIHRVDRIFGKTPVDMDDEALDDSSRAAMARIGFQSTAPVGGPPPASSGIEKQFFTESDHDKASLRPPSMISGVMVKQSSIEVNTETEEMLPKKSSYLDDDEDEYNDGLTARQKIALGFIWLTSGVYSILSDQVLSKERFVPCTLRQELHEKMNMISLIAAIPLPILIGPILCPIIHVFLSFCSVCCKSFLKAKGCNNNAQHAEAPQPLDCKTICIEFSLIVIFISIFLVTYPTHMYVTEVYLASIETHFAFMAFKYCFGCLHLVALPIAILVVRSDIRRAATEVYLKKSSPSDNEITFEQLQTHIGIGVEPGT